MKSITKSKMMASVIAITFLAYNILLFIIAGFEYHTASFWISWVFMLLAFAVGAGITFILKESGMVLKDWLFGYPIIKLSTIYLIVEFIASVLFMLLENDVEWKLPFIVQLLVFCVFAVLIISCFIAKQNIEDVTNKVSDKTRFIKILRADAEMLVAKCSDAETKTMCEKLADAIRYSDPMSNEALFELEKEIALAVGECDNAIVASDWENAKHFCNKANLLLTERNKKCKVLK